jgi:hypothetical protein
LVIHDLILNTQISDLYTYVLLRWLDLVFFFHSAVSIDFLTDGFLYNFVFLVELDLSLEW